MKSTIFTLLGGSIPTLLLLAVSSLRAVGARALAQSLPDYHLAQIRPDPVYSKSTHFGPVTIFSNENFLLQLQKTPSVYAAISLGKTRPAR